MPSNKPNIRNFKARIQDMIVIEGWDSSGFIGRRYDKRKGMKQVAIDLCDSERRKKCEQLKMCLRMLPDKIDNHASYFLFFDKDKYPVKGAKQIFKGCKFHKHILVEEAEAEEKKIIFPKLGRKVQVEEQEEEDNQIQAKEGKDIHSG